MCIQGSQNPISFVLRDCLILYAGAGTGGETNILYSPMTLAVHRQGNMASVTLLRWIWIREWTGISIEVTVKVRWSCVRRKSRVAFLLGSTSADQKVCIVGETVGVETSGCCCHDVVSRSLESACQGWKEGRGE